MTHDALFKQLLKTPTVFESFFGAFLPKAAQFVDFTRLEFVDKERITIDGEKRTGDLLVKTRFQGATAGFLIHLEHQAQRRPDLPWRMLEYFMLDRREYAMPVYPIAVLSYQRGAPPDPLPLEVNFPNLRVLSFNFEIVDLRYMDAMAYVNAPNPAALALAARMRCRRKNRMVLVKNFAWTLAHMVLSQAVRDMIAAFFFAYKRLSAAEELHLREEISKVESAEMRDEIMQLTNPWIEAGRREGRQEGLQEGRQQGEVELVLKQLSRRLGALSASQEKAVRKLTLPKIEDLAEALLDFSSPPDLVRWLRLNE